MSAGCDALRDFDQSPRAAPQPTKIKEALRVCHILLQDPKLYMLLLQADEERAVKVRTAGCFCGGVLHSARYPRKPRGVPLQFRQVAHQRWSFCCARSGCRSRHTPPSVFYLGRRVYVGAVMLLGTALRCTVSGQALRELCQVLGVPRATLDRWRAWWQCAFPVTRCWQAARGAFMPPVSAPLPANLLARFTAADPLAQLVQTLHFLAPLSTVTEGR